MVECSVNTASSLGLFGILPLDGCRYNPARATSVLPVHVSLIFVMIHNCAGPANAVVLSRSTTIDVPADVTAGMVVSKDGDPPV